MRLITEQKKDVIQVCKCYFSAVHRPDCTLVTVESCARHQRFWFEPVSIIVKRSSEIGLPQTYPGEFKLTYLGSLSSLRFFLTFLCLPSFHLPLSSATLYSPV